MLADLEVLVELQEVVFLDLQVVKMLDLLVLVDLLVVIVVVDNTFTLVPVR